MEKIKGFFKDKSYGFYVSIVVTILALVTAIVYAKSYGKLVNYMSWAGFALLLVGAIVSLVLGVLAQLLHMPKLNNLIPPVLALVGLIGLLLFIKYIYNYVLIVLVGIDISSFDSKFIACVVMFLLTFVAAVANVFFKQIKTEEEEVKEAVNE